MSSTETKGIRVVDTQGVEKEYVGADNTQFDDEGNLLVVKAGIAIAVYSRSVWHHADNL